MCARSSGLIDESTLDELQIDTPELQLHVRRGRPLSPDAEPEAPAAARRRARCTRSRARCSASSIVPPAPGAAPYVEVGARVEPDTVVCLVEVMKMMNSIVAGVAGTIVQVCADNAELVEFGQPLFRIEVE